MNSRLKVEIVGASLLIPACVGMFSAGVPTLYCPLPAMTILPSFLLASPVLLYTVVLTPVIVFFLWNPSLLNEKANVPKRTIAAVALLSTLTIVYFATSWDYGVQYQGARHTVIMLIISSAWLALLWSLIVRCWRQPSFTTNLLLHWVLFAWLGWYAFPYLGELP